MQGLFSNNKFYHDLRSQGIPVAKVTLHEYLSYLEDALLVRPLSISAGLEHKRMVKPRKVYPIDMGIAASFEIAQVYLECDDAQSTLQWLSKVPEDAKSMQEEKGIQHFKRRIKYSK